MKPEDKIVKIIDGQNTTIQATVSQVGSVGAINVSSIETSPVDASKTNPSTVLGYTGANLTTITKTIGATSYRQTLGYTGSDLTSISAWVQL